VHSLYNTYTHTFYAYHAYVNASTYIQIIQIILIYETDYTKIQITNRSHIHTDHTYTHIHASRYRSQTGHTHIQIIHTHTHTCIKHPNSSTAHLHMHSHAYNRRDNYWQQGS